MPRRLAEGRNRILHVFVVVLLASALASFGQIWTANYAWATCGGIPRHDADGASGAFVRVYGDKASVYVNSFANNQYQTWRAVAAFRNSNNFAEVGWYVQESDLNQRAHPYKTWVSDGVPMEEDYFFSDVPQGVYQMFNVNDKDDDKLWGSFWAGNQLGQDEYVNMRGSQIVDAITESERSCTKDSLLAHFNNLQFIKTANGAWQSYTNLAVYVDSPDDGWNVCLRGVTTEYDVKQIC